MGWDTGWILRAALMQIFDGNGNYDREHSVDDRPQVAHRSGAVSVRLELQNMQSRALDGRRNKTVWR